MPELPEVESVRRGLLAHDLSATIASTWRSDKALRQKGKGTQPVDFRALVGGTIETIERRGKYLIWTITKPASEKCGLLIHLGMSGRCGLARTNEPRVEHTHLVLRLADDQEIRLVDPRRFGCAIAGPLAWIAEQPCIVALGPEPLSDRLDPQHFTAQVAKQNRPIRDTLLDQTLIAGVGNIYAVEALHAVGIHPLSPARSLTKNHWRDLLSALQEVLQRGIDNGGTSLKDFRNVTGEVGKNQDDLRVYGRSGQACYRCKATLMHGTSAGRTFTYCPSHQKHLS
jgi:formamidopyrimidine-DNA glycosylase